MTFSYRKPDIHVPLSKSSFLRYEDYECGAELTLVDYPTMDDKVVIPLKSSDRLKQENHNGRNVQV